MKKQIETVNNQISALENKQISGISASESTLNLEFGNITLAIACFFRFVFKDKIILSSKDLLTDSFDACVKSFFSSFEGYVVNAMEIGNFGNLVLKFKNKVELEVITDSSYDTSMWSLDGLVVTPYEIRIGGE